MRTALALVCLVCSPLLATDWLCTEEASQRTGSLIRACGIGQGADENEARLKAFDAAKTEFGKVCEASDDCKGHQVSVEPARTACEKTPAGVKCYRLIVFTIGEAGGSPAQTMPGVVVHSIDGVPVTSSPDKAETFAPFTYGQIAKLPKIRKGMTKAALLKAVGAPVRVDNWAQDYDCSGLPAGAFPVGRPHPHKGLELQYQGELCKPSDKSFHAHTCAVHIENGRVFDYQDIDFRFTEDLK